MGEEEDGEGEGEEKVPGGEVEWGRGRGGERCCAAVIMGMGEGWRCSGGGQSDGSTMAGASRVLFETQALQQWNTHTHTHTNTL